MTATRPIRISAARRAVALVPTVLAFPGAAAAQADWRQVPSPSARSHPAVVHDPVRHVTVLYGGAGAAPLHDTWEWHGGVWHAVAASGPVLDVVHGGLFDPVRQQVVVFGTPRPVTPLEVWGFDGVRWVQHPSPSTAPVGFAAVTRDSGRGRIVVNAELPTQSNWRLWEWDGASWHVGAVLAALWSGDSGPMQYDPVRQQIVTLRGRSTFTFDGSAWTERYGQLGVRGYAMTWDPRRQAVVLAGGDRGGVVRSSDAIWLWNGSTWTRDAISLPDPRQDAGLCFDAASNGLLLVGGQRLESWSGPAAIAVGTWREESASFARADAAEPAASEGGALCHDAARDRLVLFGGRTGTAQNRHFERDPSGRWAERSFAGAPAARWKHRLVFDRARQVALLFGGLDAAPLGDTWTFDGSAWRQAAPASAPSARYDHAMAADDDRGIVVLYGGRDGATILRDTWEWDGAGWQQRVASFPPAEQRSLLAWHPRRHRTVLVTSGMPGPVTSWEWDGTNWTSPPPAPTRPDLAARALHYDGDRDRLVLAGSAGGAAQTWEHDGSDWRLADSDARLDRDGTFGFDPPRGRLVFFGGRTAAGRVVADLWEYASASPARYEEFGQGCPGAAGVPTLTADSLPWLGDTISIRVGSVAPAALALLLGGFSRSAHLGNPLPLELGPFGFPGCQLLVAPWYTEALAGAAASRTTRLAIPGDPGLLGLEFFQQALAFDAATAALALSHGRAARLGMR